MTPTEPDIRVLTPMPDGGALGTIDDQQGHPGA